MPQLSALISAAHAAVTLELSLSFHVGDGSEPLFAVVPDGPCGESDGALAGSRLVQQSWSTSVARDRAAVVAPGPGLRQWARRMRGRVGRVKDAEMLSSAQWEEAKTIARRLPSRRPHGMRHGAGRLPAEILKYDGTWYEESADNGAVLCQHRRRMLSASR